MDIEQVAPGMVTMSFGVEELAALAQACRDALGGKGDALIGAMGSAFQAAGMAAAALANLTAAAQEEIRADWQRVGLEEDYRGLGEIDWQTYEEVWALAETAEEE